MAAEPDYKRAITFFDGQNLYHCAREAFGYSYPNYDPLALSRHVCAANRWHLKGVNFYTGYPDAREARFWNGFWQRKLLAMKRQGIRMFTRKLRYRNKTVKLDDGTEVTVYIGEEKGIDVRIAIDVIRMALDDEYDVAVIFSQDQDLSEAAHEVRAIS